MSFIYSANIAKKISPLTTFGRNDNFIGSFGRNYDFIGSFGRNDNCLLGRSVEMTIVHWI